ncbi:FERM C and FA and FERM M and FERM N domain contai ning protein [Trichuris trichiura]|uniref:Moesin/ezrin/radixin homolog 1 n=1 Tax=Trichuris trichiura TaxID=36087 RepID=A0A077Z609_TRITR|nr:FERM C and FA and FERM M and FERM N domain contai ning protein [Trichuris trichiura]
MDCVAANDRSTKVIPQGVGAPPYSDYSSKNGKVMCIQVQLLDDTISVFHLGHRSVGAALYEEVFRHLNVIETDYFGLQFFDVDGCRRWLEKSKSILKQLTACKSQPRLYFIVKFYTPNPVDLEEEYTRYLFALQIKRDLACGELMCSENTAAVLASYIVQSECGDFCAEDYPDHTYLSSAHFVPQQSAQFERKVMENHKKLVGMMPAESDIALLETARRCEFYGIKFHQAKDVEGTAVSLAVLHLGLKVYHQLYCVNTFSWAKVRKLCFKRKHFLVKLHPETYGLYGDLISFVFESRHECKLFWKKCVEHHAFFRCAEICRAPKGRTRLFAKGCSFRYDGRTQRQLVEYLREHVRKREPFSRPVLSGFNRSNVKQYTLPLVPFDDSSAKTSQSDSELGSSYSSYVNYKPQRSFAKENVAIPSPETTSSTFIASTCHTLPKSKKPSHGDIRPPDTIVSDFKFVTCDAHPRSEMFIYDTTEELRGENDGNRVKTWPTQSPQDQENISQGSYHLSETELLAQEADRRNNMSTSADSAVALGMGPLVTFDRVRPKSTESLKTRSVNFAEPTASVVCSKAAPPSSSELDVIVAKQKPIPPPKPKLGLSNLKSAPVGPLRICDDPRYAVVKHKVLDGDIPYILHVRELRVPKTNEPPTQGTVPPSASSASDAVQPAASSAEVPFQGNNLRTNFITFKGSETTAAPSIPSGNERKSTTAVTTYIKTLSSEV